MLSRHIFSSLKEEHIVRLLKSEGMTIGSHAILWDLWETESAKLGELCNVHKGKETLGFKGHSKNTTIKGFCQRLCVPL